MAAFPRRGTLPTLGEVPGLVRLAVRVLRSHTGGPPTAGTMCLVVRPDGCVAFVKASYRSLWSMPGGYCDPGEDPAKATRREVREETGLVLTGEPTLIATRDLAHRVDHFYVATADPGAGGQPTTGWEISDFTWARWADRPSLDSACAFMADAVAGGIEALIGTELARTNEPANP